MGKGIGSNLLLLFFFLQDFIPGTTKHVDLRTCLALQNQGVL